MAEGMRTHEGPRTDSIEELARFWDTHDLTDFEDGLEEVVEPVFQREIPVRILLPPQDVEAIEKTAKSRGVPCPELIREWVLEKAHTS